MTSGLPGPAMTPNRSAVLSLTAGVLALLSLCIGVVPVPFTGYVRFPAGAAFGLLAIVSGLRRLSTDLVPAEGAGWR